MTLTMNMGEQADQKPELDEEVLYREYVALARSSTETLEKLIQWADEGSRISMLYLGFAHEVGRGVPVDFWKAEQWYKRAAESGLVRAHLTLGCMYLKRRRYPEAQASFEIAAANNFLPAFHQLGRMYFYGNGVEKDFVKAKEFLERASLGGNIAAKLQLAHLLKSGAFGVRQSIWGWWLSFVGFVECISVYMKNPRSERFL